MILRVVVCLGILLVTSIGEEMNLSQLMVLSIADLNSDVVMRDFFTMIRSLRLFGGRLNEATVVASMIGRRETGAAQVYNAKILREIAMLVDELTFIHPAASIYHRNMNKLNAFAAYDSFRFSHILWLDADILILDDPTPLFEPHSMPGSINCVPEFYSYLRRYPAVNDSRLLWSDQLFPLEMEGSGDVAPAGTCNTGVMLFDSVTLSQIRDGVSEAMSSHFVPDQYLSDRFLDSLYLVQAINRKGILIDYWPYSLNYMSFFYTENDRMQLDIDRVYLAHFLWEPEFYCHAESVDVCKCVLKQESHLSGNILHRTLTSKVDGNETACRYLSGMNAVSAPHKPDIAQTVQPAPPVSGTLSERDALAQLVWNQSKGYFQPNATSIDEDIARSLCASSFPDSRYVSIEEQQRNTVEAQWQCNLDWPPSRWFTRLISTQHAVSMQFVIACTSTISIESGSTDVALELMQLSGRLLITSASTSVVYPTALSLSPVPGTQEDTTNQTHRTRTVLFATDQIDILIMENSFSALPYPLVHNVSVSLSLQFVAVHHKRNNNLNQPFYCHHQGHVYSHVTVVSQQLLPRPTTRFYAPQFLSSVTSLQLETQLLLPEFLMQGLFTSTPSSSTTATGDGTVTASSRTWQAVFLCCETVKGLQTVQRILRQFSAEKTNHPDHNSVSLVILLVTWPAGYHAVLRESVHSAVQTISDVSEKLRVVRAEVHQRLIGEYCGSTACHIISFLDEKTLSSLFDEHSTSPPPPTSRTTDDVSILLQAMRANVHDLVYLDVILPTSRGEHYQSMLQLLRLSYRLLRPELGLFMGSRYVFLPVTLYSTPVGLVASQSAQQPVPEQRFHSLRLEPTTSSASSSRSSSSQTMSRKQVSRRALRLAVDTLALEKSVPVFYTYAEQRQPEYCPAGVQDDEEVVREECSPAWFIFKTRRQ